MPKLWNETVDAHRNAVRQAILDATWALVSEHGMTAVTMSQIAQKSGIGRATLYKYFPDVDTILLAWHRHHVTAHLEQLAAVRDKARGPAARLNAVLTAYARISYHREQHGAELMAFLHRDDEIAPARRQLVDLFRDVIGEVMAHGDIRDDIAAGELAGYCLHALSAAGALPSEAAVHRLVRLTLDGLRPPGARVRG
ncbi:TetR family transcriptional regulator [Amycolatopsis antarctica]|uniref:TetR family transcriptional regulator n=1 Tax=Amycolatopsis antarctica TaxID=1854586 RepID=A0A263CXA7_9PSEU|nr:TetR family transcriptional regulator [Amycolatopsis antarctica]OZM70783.1 TetR family transcriptional regulator [Amycolatopsis antarctica]